MTAPAVVRPFPVVVVGASWGGLHALSVLVGGLPAAFAAPVVIVQHRSRDAHSFLGELLQDHTPLPVCEVEDKQVIAPGQIYLAPADYHLLVEDGHFALTVDEPVRFSRPSIDVTFSSAADSFGARVVGVALTGANDDGAAGLRRIVDRGGRALVQDPAGAEVRTMPAAALRAVPKAEVVELERIAGRLVELVGGAGGAERGARRAAPARTARPTDPSSRSALGARRPPDARP